MTESQEPGQRARSVLFLQPSDEAYGADRVLLRLATGLRERGWRVKVLVSDDQPAGWLSQRLQEASIDVSRGPLAPARRQYLSLVALPAYGRALLRARRWVRMEAQRFDASLIHVNTSALLVGAIVGRPAGARLVWHVHEIVTRPRLLSWVFRFAPMTTSDRVIAVSRAVRDHLSPRGFARRRIALVWNGIEDRPVTGRVSTGADDAPVVAFVGRLNRWKGYDIFVDAIALVIPDYPEARFLIAGDPPPGEEWRGPDLLQRLSGLGIADHVDVLGFREDIPALLDQVDIVAVPSVWPEPFGLVTLEAMRAGRAVVATAHGGALDLIEDGRSGLLVQPGDGRALAHAISTLLSDPQLRGRLGVEARDRFKTSFSVRRFIDAMEEVYLGTLRQPGGR